MITYVRGAAGEISQRHNALIDLRRWIMGNECSVINVIKAR